MKLTATGCKPMRNKGSGSTRCECVEKNRLTIVPLWTVQHGLATFCQGTGVAVGVMTVRCAADGGQVGYLSRMLYIFRSSSVKSRSRRLHTDWISASSETLANCV